MCAPHNVTNAAVRCPECRTVAIALMSGDCVHRVTTCPRCAARCGPGDSLCDTCRRDLRLGDRSAA